METHCFYRSCVCPTSVSRDTHTFCVRCQSRASAGFFYWRGSITSMFLYLTFGMGLGPLTTSGYASAAKTCLIVGAQKMHREYTTDGVANFPTSDDLRETSRRRLNHEIISYCCRTTTSRYRHFLPATSALQIALFCCFCNNISYVISRFAKVIHLTSHCAYLPKTL